MWHDRRVLSAVSIVARLASELVGWVALAFQSRQSLHAEVLFLRRQLALYVERGVKPRRIDAATRVSLALLSRLFQWRSALVVVRPQTLIRWHRAGFKLFWRVKSHQQLRQASDLTPTTVICFMTATASSLGSSTPRSAASGCVF